MSLTYTEPSSENATATESLNNKPASRRILNLLKRAWPFLVALTVLLLLAMLYRFTVNQFNSEVTVDHAQHGKTSPNVHKIVHIRQKLLIGTDPSNPPFSFKPTSELVGFDIDLSKAIARELNVPVEFKEFKFGPSLSASGLGSGNLLTQDKVDIVISGVTVNRSRQQYYNFSKPYLSAGLVAITKTGSTAIQQSADVSGKRLGVITDDPAIGYVNSTTTEDNIFIFTTKEEAVHALQNETIDALIIEAPVAQFIINEKSELHIATDLLTQDDYAVMVMREKQDLVDEVNSILNLLRQKGVLESLRHKWLK